MQEPSKPARWTDIVQILWPVLLCVAGLIYVGGGKSTAVEQSQKELAGLRADMKEGFQIVGQQINGIPDERAKVKALEFRAIEAREELNKHDARIRITEDAVLRMRMSEDATQRIRADVDNLKAAVLPPVPRR